MGVLADLVPVVTDLGVLVVVAWLIATGRLVPGSTVDRLIQGRDEIITQQRATIERQQATISQQQSQVGALVSQGETSARALEALRDSAGGEGSG